MTLRANINLPIPRHRRQFYDACRRVLGGHSFHMLTRGTVAAFARYSEHEAIAPVLVRRRGWTDARGVGCMTFQTARHYGPIEVCGAIAIAGAIHPTGK